MGTEHMQEAKQSKRDRAEESKRDWREKSPYHVSSKHTQFHAAF